MLGLWVLLSVESPLGIDIFAYLLPDVCWGDANINLLGILVWQGSILGKIVSACVAEVAAVCGYPAKGDHVCPSCESVQGIHSFKDSGAFDEWIVEGL